MQLMAGENMNWGKCLSWASQPQQISEASWWHGSVTHPGEDNVSILYSDTFFPLYNGVNAENRFAVEIKRWSQA